MINIKLIRLTVVSFVLTNCNEQTRKNVTTHETIIYKDVAQLELKDSSMLTHVKGQFYKNRAGELFQKTFTDRELAGVDTLVKVEYFNGKLPQDLDPLTFEELDGWFAKDKYFAYYYRPTSGGMLIVKLDSADCKSFKILAGQYLYAVDNNHVFKETEILENINPQTMEIIKDKDGKIIKLISGLRTYLAD